MTERSWILLVEDDIDLRLAMSERLTQAGFRVAGCDRAAEAIRMLNNQKFHAVLLDLKLARGDGLQVIGHLKSRDVRFNAETPVIVVSGTLEMKTIQELRGVVRGILVRPFDQEKLLESVNKVVRAPAPENPPAAGQPERSPDGR